MKGEGKKQSGQPSTVGAADRHQNRASVGHPATNWWGQTEDSAEDKGKEKKGGKRRREKRNIIFIGRTSGNYGQEAAWDRA